MWSSGITAIAHRGASYYVPENTFAAFDLAVEMSIGEIELDVQFAGVSHHLFSSGLRLLRLAIVSL